MTHLDQLQTTSYDVAEEKGFHEAQAAMDPEIAALYLRLLLVVGELSEAAEELRAGHHPTKVYYEYPESLCDELDVPRVHEYPYLTIARRADGARSYAFVKTQTMAASYAQMADVVAGKPCGFPIELADAQIRLADLAESVKRGFGEAVSLTTACAEKERYNRTRAHLHGKTA